MSAEADRSLTNEDTAEIEQAVVMCEDLYRIYKTDEIEVVALQGLDITVEHGELVGVIGNSGSGKSTLLNIIGGLDKPTAGRIYVDGKDLLKFSDADLIRYRKESVGFVWQNNARNLVAYLNALENVEIPMILASKRSRRERAQYLLDLVGLSHRMRSRLTELSGGEQQRVAIAISLANEPKLLLADEPTGNVDSKTADRIFRVFRDVSERLGVTVIIVTHDRRISRAVNRVVAIRDGRTSSEFIRRSASIEDISAFSDNEGMVEGGTHEELAVLDKAGRLQLPEEYLEELGLTGLKRVKVEIEDGRIIVRRPTDIDND